MDLIDMFGWDTEPYLLYVAIGGAFLLLAFLVIAFIAAAGRNGKADDTESERAFARSLARPVEVDEPDEDPEPPVLYVAPTYQIAHSYLRREGINPLRARIATQGHQIRGFRGRIVMIDGERTAFVWPDGLEDDLWAAVGIGNATLERVYA